MAARVAPRHVRNAYREFHVVLSWDTNHSLMWGPTQLGPPLLASGSRRSCTLAPNRDRVGGGRGLSQPANATKKWSPLSWPVRSSWCFVARIQTARIPARRQRFTWQPRRNRPGCRAARYWWAGACSPPAF